MKKCSKCGIEKPLDKFNIRKDSSSGYRKDCKDCIKIYNSSPEFKKRAKKRRDDYNSNPINKEAIEYNKLKKKEYDKIRRSNPEIKIKSKKYQTEYYLKNKSKIIERQKKYSMKPEVKKARREYLKKYLTSPKESLKRSARSAVSNGLRDGKISKMPCNVCGEVKVEAHHLSYEKENWLNVKWLCVKHHAEEHSKIRESKALN